MSETDGDRSISDVNFDDYQFDLGSFFESNYKLFAVLSIFGAISIYIVNLTEEATMARPIRVGFVSSQILFVLTGIIILRELRSEFDTVEIFLWRVLVVPDWDTIELIVFTVSFIGLMFSILSISTSFLGTLSFVMEIFGLFVGFAFPLWVLAYISNEDDEDNQEGFDDIGIMKKTLVSVIIFIPSLLVLTAAVNSLRIFGYPPLFTFNANTLTQSLIASLLAGVATSGFFYVVGAFLLGVLTVIEAIHFGCSWFLDLLKSS